jgi:two-component system sensor histidine kinase DegS
MFLEATDQEAERSDLAERSESLERMLDVSERQRELIGYEIHDTFVQDMVTALMHLDAYRWAAQSAGDKATRELELTADALRDGVKQARRLIDRVQPPDLEAAGLIGALRCLIDRTLTHANLPVDLSADLSFPRLPAEYEMAVYRMVQECLNNIIRHSQAPKARVELRSSEEEVEVEVRDWGLGFDPAAVEGNHYGLMGIRHRVRLLNGQTEITSRPQWGTRVTIRLPLDVPVEQAFDT